MSNDLEQFSDLDLEGMAHGNNPVANAYRELLAFRKAANSPAIPEWNNEQCLEFLQVAFRHNNIDGEIEFDDIRLGVKFALAAAPKPESE